MKTVFERVIRQGSFDLTALTARIVYYHAAGQLSDGDRDDLLAQARANGMIADAQARAQQMVAESEIVARAQAQAQDMLDSARRDCDAFAAQTRDSINALMAQADDGLARQLDALRALRQDITSAQ